MCQDIGLIYCILCFFFRNSPIQVDIYESRPFIGGKVGSFVDKRGNHIEMGLHVFFGCYSNLFRLMKKVYKFYLQSYCLFFSLQIMYASSLFCGPHTCTTDNHAVSIFVMSIRNQISFFVYARARWVQIAIYL